MMWRILELVAYFYTVMILEARVVWHISCYRNISLRYYSKTSFVSVLWHMICTYDMINDLHQPASC